MDWFERDIWPNLDGTENLPFTGVQPIN